MELAGRTLLGKYRIEGLLGQGGMGSVWKGAHLVTGRKVAIKVLDDRFLTNVNVVQRFGREARAASAIQHEGIVEVLDLDQTEEGHPFLVMEFLDGESLTSRIERRGRLPQDEVVRIGTMLLEALEAAHQHGVVHRDLKPDNIHLVPAGRRGEIVKILDFGISSKDDEASAKLTMTGSVLGTPHYMSPEQAMGDTHLDRRVDIYGAGVVLYECLVGDVPFDAPNYNRLLRVILDDEPVPPSQRGALVERPLEEVVLSAIAKDRERRPQTARALLERMRTAVGLGLAGDSSERALGEDLARAGPRRSASASFARPADLGPLTATPTPSPAPLASGVRARGGLSQALAAAAGSDLGSAASSKPPPGEHLGAPHAPPPPKPALRLDAPTGGGGLGALDELDGPVSGSPSLELDESALARPSRGDPTSPTARSGTHRAISERSMNAAAATPPRSIPPADGSLAGRARTPSGTSSSGMMAAAADERRRSSDSLPAMRAPASVAHTTGPHGAIEEAPSAPARGGIAGWWQGLSDDTRRRVIAGVVGAALFVIAVAAVRALVRPGEPTPAFDPSLAPTTTSADPPSTTAEWVVIDVDGVPPRAQLRLDGLPGATLPLRVRRGGDHVLDIQAPGYVDGRLEFRADANRRLRADMRPAIGTSQPAP